jgi:hypothetical protein
MVVDFIKQLHQEALEKAWNARPAKAPKDPMPRRRQIVLASIDNALAQLTNGDTNPRRGSYQTRDNFNGVRVQLKYAQRALTIDGRDHWFVGDAATFFSKARVAVESGELDSAINDALEQKGRGKTKAKVTRLVRNGKPQVDKAPDRKPAPASDAIKAAAASDASADTPPTAKPGKYAQKYEDLLAAGTFSGSAF